MLSEYLDSINLLLQGASPKEIYLQCGVAIDDPVFKMDLERNVTAAHLNIETRGKVISALGIVGDSDSFDVVLDMIINDDNEYLTQTGASVLTRIAPQRAFPALIELHKSVNVSSKIGILAAIRSIPPELIRDELIELAYDPDPVLRQIAVSKLYQGFGAEMLHVFVSASTDRSEKVQAQAISALSRIYSPDVSDTIIPIILQGLDRPSNYVRIAAISALCRVPLPQAVDSLERISVEHEDTPRYLIVEALKQIGTPKANRLLDKLTESSSS